MDKVEILARLRSLIDESTEVLYDDDDELYPALTLAQTEVCNVISNGWFSKAQKEVTAIPQTIQPLLTIAFASLTTGIFSFVLTDMIVPLNLQWNPTASDATAGDFCLPISNRGEARKLLKNSLLADGFYMWWDGGRMYLNPKSSFGTAGYVLEYIKKPDDITSSVNPESDGVCHDAIVERACWILLKDRESEQASTHLQLYGSLMEGLMI